MQASGLLPYCGDIYAGTARPLISSLKCGVGCFRSGIESVDGESGSASSWIAPESLRPVHAGRPLAATTAAWSVQVATTSRVSGQRYADAIAMRPRLSVQTPQQLCEVAGRAQSGCDRSHQQQR